MSRAEEQRRHYDDLVRTRRATRFAVSCGFADRFDPALLERRPALIRALERLFERLLPERTGTLVDLGCGTAYYWPILAPRCERLLGLDLSRQMVACGQRHDQRRAGTRGTRAMLCCAADLLPVASESVDTVLVIDALHHVDALSVVLREVHRMLKPGGVLLAVEPNVFNPVVFFAHLVPREERGALWPNHPLTLRRALRDAFGEVAVEPVTYVSGVESAAALAVVERLEPLFEHRPLSGVALRMIYRARRR